MRGPLGRPRAMINHPSNFLAPILARLDARDWRQKPGISVWELHEPGIFAWQGSSRRMAIEAAKRALLITFASQATPCFLSHPDNPADYCKAFSWDPQVHKLGGYQEPWLLRIRVCLSGFSLWETGRPT
jgi:hypothetical protein